MLNSKCYELRLTPGQDPTRILEQRDYEGTVRSSL